MVFFTLKKVATKFAVKREELNVGIVAHNIH